LFLLGGKFTGILKVVLFHPILLLLYFLLNSTRERKEECSVENLEDRE
jgi:hypothetical protein